MTFTINDITLYKSGIGFFNGVCKSNKFILPISDDTVNDILKSLAIEGLKSVTFSAAETKENIQRKIGISINSNSAFKSFGQHLIGLEIEIEIETKAKISGILLGIDTISRASSTEATVTEDIIVLKQKSKILKIPLNTIRKIRILDDNLKKDLDVFLNLEAITRKIGVTNLEIETEKENARIQWVSPISAWRLSYRVLFDNDSKKSQFIAIAIVDNTTSIDWENINLQLVTGKPVSFKYDLHTPHYVDRPWIQRDVQGTAPMLAQPSMRSTTRRSRSDSQPMPQISTAAEGRFGTAKKLKVGDETSWEISRNLMTDMAVDSTKELGSTVIFKVRKPININRSESSLIPLFSKEYEANECIVVREDRIDEAMDALIFTKDLDLEKGVATIYVNNVFAGDSMIIRGSDYIAYRLNQDIKLISENKHSTKITSIDIHDKIMYKKYTSTKSYKFKILNINDEAKTLLLEIPKFSNYDPVEKPVKETTNYHRYKFNIDPGTTEKNFTFEYTYSESVYIRDLSEDTVQHLINEKILDDRNERIVKKIFSTLSKISDKEKILAELNENISYVYSDQERLRENIKTLQKIGQDSERDNYITRLKESEKYLEDLESYRKELTKEIEELREKV